MAITSELRLRIHNTLPLTAHRQAHRRVIKTHCALDGVPRPDDVFFIAMARHPLDVALSFRDHFHNADQRRVGALIDKASGFPDLPTRDQPPDEPGEYLSWWIDNDIEADGAGPLVADGFWSRQLASHPCRFA